MARVTIVYGEDHPDFEELSVFKADKGIISASWSNVLAVNAAYEAGLDALEAGTIDKAVLDSIKVIRTMAARAREA